MIKRIFDIFVAIVVLIVLLPIYILVSILIWIFMGRPIFFIQQRAGIHGKPFNIIKFRTMKELFDKKGECLPDEKRITRIGKFLRATSLDELPQIFNILKGEMSLVGPRPQMYEFMEHYSETQKRRHEVRPGITGLAQVNGRNNLSWEEKFKLDVDYVDNHNMLMDLKIILKTVVVLLKREGINNPEVTVGASRFMNHS